ncbi:MAG: quinone-dependent dihydroorotate dehydrogenase, partial [Bacteroidales bacterium]
LEMLRYINKKTGCQLPIIGVGGIITPVQAKEMLDAGASLVQIYTGFIYNGPGFVKQILKYLNKQKPKC